MSEQNVTMLKDAIARNSPAVLSLPSAGLIHHHKSRLLGENEQGLWVESAVDDRPLIDTLIREQTPIGVAFKSGQSSVVFATPVQSRQDQYPLGNGVTVEALCLVYPNEFRQQQRRKTYRVALPHDHEIGLRLWRIAEHAVLRDRPQPSQEIAARLEDLSVMGLRALGSPTRDGQPPKATLNERLRIVLKWNREELLTEGRLMHTRPGAKGQLALGVQFRKLEKDLEGRQALARLTELVGLMQREEVKRLRRIAG